jgi:putative tryptophan/tyrosine transport system substrate-binding protein
VPCRCRAMAAELIRRQVTVIATTGPAARAARGAIATIPIVFEAGGDPVGSGIVAGLNRSGGDIMGVTAWRRLAPSDCSSRFLRASTERSIDSIFVSVVQLRTGGLVIGNGQFLNSRSGQLAALSLRHAVLAIRQDRGFPAAGGLMSSRLEGEDL